MSTSNILTVSIKCGTMASMASEASRYAMAAYVSDAYWLAGARESIASMKTYIAEIERLLDSHVLSDEVA